MSEDMKHGVYVSKVHKLGTACDVLREGDCILAMAGQQLDAYGRYLDTDFDRISFDHIINTQHIGDVITLGIFRQGRKETLEMPVSNFRAADMLVPYYRYDSKPEYIVTGGFVIQKLTRDYLRIWGEDFSGSDKDLLKITFGGAGAPETIKIYFYLHGSGGIGHYLNDEIVFSPGQSVGYYALMGSFNPQAVDVDALRQHVTGMAVYYVGAQNTDTSNWSLEKIELVPVPEPMTLSILSLGGLAVLARSRRK